MKNIKTIQLLTLVIALMIGCKKNNLQQTKTTPVITWSNPEDITLGTLLSSIQLNAVANIPGTFVYTPTIGIKLDTGTHILKVDFKPADSINYISVSKTITLHVSMFGTLKDQEGNLYKTITIGSQTWMAENLRTTHFRNGDKISKAIAVTYYDYLDWITRTTAAYSWSNDDSTYKETYGALYNWYAVNDSRNIAPVGWHVATDAEWNTLGIYLGGDTVAGGKLKERGTTHWSGPNVVNTDDAGFLALGGGYRCGDQGFYKYFGPLGYWWTSTATDASTAKNRFLYTNDINLYRDSRKKVFGFSVRCVHD